MRAVHASVLLAFLAVACDAGNSASPASAADSAVTPQSVSVSSSVAEDLTFIRQEEKMARDVYIALHDAWGLNVFSNITSSEQRHMDVMLALLDRYGVADPVAGAGNGAFVDPLVQELYGQLLARGKASLVDALTVGAIIEDFDIVDIQARLASSPPADVVTAYENLMKGSRNHLRSYVSQLKARGASYAPTYLSAEQYQSIVSTPMERGAL